MGIAGSYRRTDDGVVGPSGRPVIVYSIIVQSGGTAAVVSVYDGTTTTTKFDQIDGTINKAVVRDYGAKGMLFPNGCYIDVDTNTTFVVASVETV